MVKIINLIVLCVTILFLSAQAQNIQGDKTITKNVIRKRSPLTNLEILLKVFNEADEALTRKNQLDQRINY